jgi:hypothetical protein
MIDKRIGKDRRVNKDRRKGGISSYSGPENRGVNEQRSNQDRRETKNNSFMRRALSPVKESRRFGIDQRQFSYTDIIPEKRSDKDRRSFVDRRKK